MMRRTPLKRTGFGPRSPRREQRDPDRVRGVPTVTPGAFRAPQPVAIEPPAKPEQAAPIETTVAKAIASVPALHTKRESMTTQENQQGLKARIEKLLDDKAGELLTLGQISAALDLPKTMHAEISSCLSKLRDSGTVKSALGPASSARGRRFVKRYSMARKQKEPKVIVVSEMDARRAMAFAR